MYSVQLGSAPSLALISVLAVGLAVGCGTEIGEEVPGEAPEVSETGRGLVVFDPTTTAFSGNAGFRVFNLDRAVNTNDALVGVTAGERNDDPCFLRALFEDTGSGFSLNRTFDQCRAQERSLATIRVPRGHFVTGIRTCLNRNRNRVKGIQLLSKPRSCIINPSGTTTIENCGLVGDRRICGIPRFIDVPCRGTRSEASVHFERTNCRGTDNGPDGDWAPPRRCPEGKMATRLTLHERDGGGNRDMFDGLRLTCNRLSGNR